MHGLIVKIYISQSTSINKFIHKIFLLYEWTGKMLICLEDKCTRLIIRYRKLQLSNLIISLNLNLATKLTVCTAKHVRRSFDIVLMSLDAPVFNRCGFVYQKPFMTENVAENCIFIKTAFPEKCKLVCIQYILHVVISNMIAQRWFFKFIIIFFIKTLKFSSSIIILMYTALFSLPQIHAEVMGIYLVWSWIFNRITWKQTELDNN